MQAAHRKCNWARDDAEREFHATLIGRIRRWRQARGITQAQAAAVCRVGPGPYCSMEAGRVRFSAYQLAQLATLFGIGVSDLVPRQP